jgi:hypothetical protein
MIPQQHGHIDLVDSVSSALGHSVAAARLAIAGTGQTIGHTEAALDIEVFV